MKNPSSAEERKAFARVGSLEAKAAPLVPVATTLPSSFTNLRLIAKAKNQPANPMPNIYDDLQKSHDRNNGGGDAPMMADEMEGEGDAGMEHGINSVHLSDNCFKGAKDGESVKGQIEGTMMEHDGGRFLMVDKIDGYPVMGVEGDGEEQAQGEPSPAEPPNSMGQAASDFFSKMKKGNA